MMFPSLLAHGLQAGARFVLRTDGYNIAAGPELLRDVKGKGSVPTPVRAHGNSVDPDLRVIIHCPKVNQSTVPAPAVRENELPAIPDGR